MKFKYTKMTENCQNHLKSGKGGPINIPGLVQHGRSLVVVVPEGLNVKLGVFQEIPSASTGHVLVAFPGHFLIGTVVDFARVVTTIFAKLRQIVAGLYGLHETRPIFGKPRNRRHGELFRLLMMLTTRCRMDWQGFVVISYAVRFIVIPKVKQAQKSTPVVYLPKNHSLSVSEILKHHLFSVLRDRLCDGDSIWQESR